MKRSDTIVALAKSLKELQQQLKPVTKDKTNPFFKSRYADLESVVEASRTPLYKNGFSVTQLISHTGTDSTLETVLLHESGEWISSEMKLYMTKSDPQAQGSAITYARRYALMAIIGMVAEGEDDDGEKSSLATEPQMGMLKKIAYEKGLQTKADWETWIRQNFEKSPERITKQEVDTIKEALERIQ